MTAVRKPVSGDRRAMLAKVHLGAKELGLDEESRRDVIARVTGGLRSAGDCTDAQLDLVLAEFRRLGFQARPAAAAQSARAARPAASVPASPFHGKAKALWASLYNLGVVRNGSDRALDAFGARQLGVDSLRWADQSQGYRLTEALKAMAERAGWSQDLAGIAPAKQVTTLKRRLVQRQAELMGVAPFRLHDMTDRELDRLAAENGKAIRAAGGAAD